MTASENTIAMEAPKPLMRGTLHAATALLAPFGLVLLLAIADSPSAYVGAAIFAASLCALYTTSAIYHLLPWRGWSRGLMHRLDHAMIFALIAGTYTPFCLIVLGYGGWGITMLALVWTLAGLGVLVAAAWPAAPRWLNVSLYLALGWIGVIAASEIVPALEPVEMALLALGGLLYTVGAVVYAMKWPDPHPRIFGFHEVFHVFVIAGTVVHFILIAAYILPS